MQYNAAVQAVLAQSHQQQQGFRAGPEPQLVGGQQQQQVLSQYQAAHSHQQQQLQFPSDPNIAQSENMSSSESQYNAK